MRGWFVFVALGSLVGQLSAAEPSTLEKTFREQVKPFLHTYCERCHQADKMTSGIRVDHLDATLDERHLKLWTEISKELSHEAMPPDGAKQPSKEERARIVAWVKQGLDTARARPTPKNGSIRRLTVAQYKNTLRELLLLDDDATSVLPPDAISRDGFVNNQSTLQLSPLLLESYFDIADKALSRVIVDPTKKPTIQHFRVELGAGINPKPFPEALILGADSLLLKNSDFSVTEPKLVKSFPYDAFAMRTKYRFIEGYRGNDTVRGWREYDSIYHAVFACMRGSHGYPKGHAYNTVPQGLLLRPAIPSSELFGIESTYGPKANFKIALRELPHDGRFRVTVTAAKYDDGLLLEPGTVVQPEGPATVAVHDFKDGATVTLPNTGIYQVDLHAMETSTKPKKPVDVTLTIGDRHFSSPLTQAAFVVVRLPSGAQKVQLSGAANVSKIVFAPLQATHPLAVQFTAFEKRDPLLGVHMGFRRDCGSTLAPVGEPQTVAGTQLKHYVFEGFIRNFPSPDVEEDNVNYLAGIREIGVRSEYTDGRDRPRLVVRSVEFEGPYFETWPPPAHRRLFVEFDNKNDADAYARHIIRTFATKAFRRPVTAQEEATLVGVYEKSVKAGASFHAAIKDSLHVVLTAPQFLFLIENSQTPNAEPLDDHELASKLAYFLWNGPPDARLLQLAAQGALRKNLDAEVTRLLKDQRSMLFVREFVSQWLALDKFQVLEPDRKQFPKLTRDTRLQLQQEPIQFVEYLIRQNLPVRNFIRSDFVLANEVTANYYGLPNVETGFRFAPVRHGRADLGGVLTQSAILAGLSDGRESNPIKRGAWMARKIIADPPDDPPPNVPMLKEEKKNLTLRERLFEHRNQPGCAQCHAKIDPWGVPFEEFDAGGRFKTKKVDARSTLPDKTEVKDFADLQRYLTNDRLDQVAFSVLKHLATYACGRNLTYNEIENLRRDGLQLKAEGYRLQEMIRWLVHSPIFLEK